MKDWDLIRSRYMQDSMPVRLGGLAANLSRIKSFAEQETNQDAVGGLIAESKHFIEWTASEADWNTAGELAELQVQLARWECTWERLWPDPTLRAQMADQSRQWSERVLILSGLLSA